MSNDYNEGESFAADIEEAAGGEVIEAVVIGPFGWNGWSEGTQHANASARQGVILTWEEARPLLDYAYDTGYGSPDCHAIRAWTAFHVLSVIQYDGSTGVTGVPRNPVTEPVSMPGG